jgi:hypothetical protein
MKSRYDRLKEAKAPSVVVFISKRSRKQDFQGHCTFVAHGATGMECIAKRRGKRPLSLNPEVVFTAKPIAPQIRRCREADLEKRNCRFFSSPSEGGPSPTTLFHPFVLGFGNNLIDGFIAQSPHPHDSDTTMGYTAKSTNQVEDVEPTYAPIWSLHISLGQLQEGHNSSHRDRMLPESQSETQPTALNEWKSVSTAGKNVLSRNGDQRIMFPTPKIQEFGPDGDDLSDLQDLFQQNMHVVKIDADELSELRERFAQHMLVNPNTQLACQCA